MYTMSSDVQPFSKFFQKYNTADFSEICKILASFPAKIASHKVYGYENRFFLFCILSDENEEKHFKEKV